MKVINNKIHGVLDYVTVVSFALLPTIFGLTGMPGLLSYALAAIHLLMTVLTKFEFGLVKVIPLKLHKIVEMIVGPVLLVAPWILGFSGDTTARFVFIGAGIVIIIVGQVSQYNQEGME